MNKRLLKQQYLDTPVRAGVYAIRNLVNGRVFVAGSMNIEGALNCHRFELRQGSHRNALLRQDWLQHGEASFRFDTLDTVRARDEPSFNLARELGELLALWRAEIPCQGEQGYCHAGSAA
jgi:hypothetical protein